LWIEEIAGNPNVETRTRGENDANDYRDSEYNNNSGSIHKVASTSFNCVVIRLCRVERQQIENLS
jgi:hypothetical protein